MLLLKNGFLEKIETWHVGLSCQYTHFMSFSSKSEHDTVADQATLNVIQMISLCYLTNRGCYSGRAELLQFDKMGVKSIYTLWTA